MDKQILVVERDITRESVDAIVNAANSTLYGGGGVDGAIHAAGGPAILEACKVLRDSIPYMRGLRTGDAVETTAGGLKAHFVIHTVGPKHWEYPDGGVGLLRACHMNALAVADRLGCTSLAFPAISCGIYGWKVRDAAPIAINAIQSYWETHPDSVVETVRFVLFDGESLNAFQSAIESSK